jgi:hypothetical protein
MAANTNAPVKHLPFKPVKPGRSRAKASMASGKSSVFQAGLEGMMGVTDTTMSLLGKGGNTSAAVLSAAFGGTSSAMGMYGGSSPYASASTGTLGLPGMEGVSTVAGSSGGSVIPGTEGFSQADLINSMNQNNLKLLELQALMQSNMQAWNTKSNILNADHRVKTTMIEKLSPR